VGVNYYLSDIQIIHRCILQNLHSRATEPRNEHPEHIKGFLFSVETVSC